MAIPHECRLCKYVGPDCIPYALVVAHDMFNLQELLEKISAILDYINSMLPHVNADGVIFFPINAPGMGRFQLLNLGVLGYGLELRFWVVIAIIVSLKLTITLITTLTII